MTTVGPTQYISGLVSSLDWSNVIDELMQVYRSQRIEPLEDRRSDFEEKLSAWQELSSKLSDLKNAVEAISGGSAFSVYQATLSSSATDNPESILTVTASSSAQEGVYYLEVLQIAQAHQMASKSFSSATDPLGLSGTVTINGVDITVADTDSLYDVRDKINSSVDGVVASVLKVSDTEWKLLLTSEETGTANQITVDDPEGLFDFTTTVEAQDAILEVNSIQITRPSNVIRDAIEGLTIKLKRAASGTTITLTVSKDLEAIEQNIQQFVDAYNEVHSFVSDQFTYSEGTEKPLMGEVTLHGIQSNLQSRILQTVSDLPDGWNALTFYGVSFDRYGNLSFDSSEFESKFSEDPDTTIQLFTSVASSLEDYLDDVTDPYTGLIKTKTDSLQSQIDDINEQIERQEFLLDLKRQRLMEQFIALEDALSQLRALSSWLSQQIEASFGNYT